MESKLVNGLIPARTNCPFAIECTFKQNNGCDHKGKDHTVSFSCGAARGYDLMAKRKAEFAAKEDDPKEE